MPPISVTHRPVDPQWTVAISIDQHRSASIRTGLGSIGIDQDRPGSTRIDQDRPGSARVNEILKVEWTNELEGIELWITFQNGGSVRISRRLSASQTTRGIALLTRKRKASQTQRKQDRLASPRDPVAWQLLWRRSAKRWLIGWCKSRARIISKSFQDPFNIYWRIFNPPSLPPAPPSLPPNPVGILAIFGHSSEEASRCFKMLQDASRCFKILVQDPQGLPIAVEIDPPGFGHFGLLLGRFWHASGFFRTIIRLPDLKLQGSWRIFQVTLEKFWRIPFQIEKDPVGFDQIIFWDVLWDGITLRDSPGSAIQVTRILKDFQVGTDRFWQIPFQDDTDAPGFDHYIQEHSRIVQDSLPGKGFLGIPDIETDRSWTTLKNPETCPTPRSRGEGSSATHQPSSNKAGRTASDPARIFQPKSSHFHPRTGSPDSFRQRPPLESYWGSRPILRRISQGIPLWRIPARVRDPVRKRERWIRTGSRRRRWMLLLLLLLLLLRLLLMWMMMMMWGSGSGSGSGSQWGGGVVLPLRRPWLSGAEQEEDSVIGQPLEVLSVVDVRPVWFEDQPHGVAGAAAQLFPTCFMRTHPSSLTTWYIIIMMWRGAIDVTFACVTCAIHCHHLSRVVRPATRRGSIASWSARCPTLSRVGAHLSPWERRQMIPCFSRHYNSI